MQTWFIAVLFVAVAAGAAEAQFASDRDRREALDRYREGQELMERERFEQAAEAFQGAIDKDPLFTLAHYGLGQSYMALRRYTSAVHAFTACREAFRTLHQLHQKDRMRVERQRDDEIREVRESLRRIRSGQVGRSLLTADKLQRHLAALERQRSLVGGVFRPPAEVALSLGSAYFRSGALADAEREYRAALDVDPDMGEAHNNLAVVLMLTGRLEEAGREIEQAKASGFPVNPMFEKDLEKARQAAGVPR